MSPDPSPLLFLSLLVFLSLSFLLRLVLVEILSFLIMYCPVVTI